MKYKVVIKREPEVIRYDTYEEAETKMKELFQQYGYRPSKYYMATDKPQPSNDLPHYECDEQGNVIKLDLM